MEHTDPKAQHRVRDSEIVANFMLVISLYLTIPGRGGGGEEEWREGEEKGERRESLFI